MRKQTVLLLVLSGFLLAGCGKKGPLYHPDDKPQSASATGGQPAELRLIAKHS